MKHGKKMIAGFAALLLICTTLFSAAPVKADTSLPDTIYLAQAQGSDTCTLVAATMMMRAKLYLAGDPKWTGVTEAAVKPVAWAPGLYYYFTYSIGNSSLTVSHAAVSGMKATSLKQLLDAHPEGIVFYVEADSFSHAVFVTDYVGDTFYCAEPVPYLSGERIPLKDSWISVAMGNVTQKAVLNAATDYWYISSSSIDPTETHNLTKVKAVSPTCTENGNIRYWYCSDCGKYFSDKYGTTQIKKSQTVLKATGHSFVTDTITPATFKRNGKVTTKCSACGIAGESQVIKKIGDIILSGETFTYTGYDQRPFPIVTDSDGMIISDDNMEISFSEAASVSPGSYEVTVNLINAYSGSKTLSYKIDKARNEPTKVSSSKKLRYRKLQKEKQTFQIHARVKDNAKITYKLMSVSKKARDYVKVSSKGKVTVRKNLPKGTYKIKVRVTAKRTENYKTTSVYKTIKLIVR